MRDGRRARERERESETKGIQHFAISYIALEEENSPVRGANKNMNDERIKFWECTV